MALPDGTHLFVLGSSHHNTSLETREQFALTSDQLDRAYRSIGAIAGMREVLILSTCNRVEVYGLAAKSIDHSALAAHLAEFWQLSPEDVKKHSFWHVGSDVIEHLFEVSCGLDSAMVGETEILGQIKSAYADATGRGTLGSTLNRIFQKSFQAAKWVRTHTAIGRGQVSIGNVAAELAIRICGELSGTHVLLCGTGEVGQKTLQSLASRGADEISVASRSRPRARELAEQYRGAALTIDDALAKLLRIDIVISATLSQTPIIDYTLIRNLMRSRPTQPLFLIDLAVPRNIAPQCADIANVYLYNIDDLGHIANENLNSRRAEIDSCKSVLKARAKATWGNIKQHHPLSAADPQKPQRHAEYNRPPIDVFATD